VQSEPPAQHFGLVSNILEMKKRNFSGHDYSWRRIGFSSYLFSQWGGWPVIFL